MRVKIHRKSSFAPSSEALYGVSYRPKLRGQWVPVLRLLAAAALAWVLINALVEAYGVGGANLDALNLCRGLQIRTAAAWLQIEC